MHRQHAVGYRKTALGDVFTTHAGKTGEVFDTVAEGRLVMCDALELATEEQPDAIIDIATLTGSCARALGSDIAGLFGNDPALVAQVTAGEATGELMWELPLHPPYRSVIESDVADLRNCGPIGKPDAIIAALYPVGVRTQRAVGACGHLRHHVE